MMTEQCIICKHFNKQSEYLTCEAFENEIPDDILSGEFDHTKKHPEQENDILFETIEKK